VVAEPTIEPERTGRIERQRTAEGAALRAPTIAPVETVYRTKAHTVPRSVMSNDDQRARLHAQLLAEATVGIAQTYGDETTPAGRGVVQVVEELPDGRLSVLLTVAIRRRV
jgi:hypothetical protein